MFSRQRITECGEEKQSSSATQDENIPCTPTTSRERTERSYFPFVLDCPYFVDKSLLIKAIVKDVGDNILLTAPRRFGKSVNLDMISRFFDLEESNRPIFEKLKIKEYPNIIKEHCGRYAVLRVDFSQFKNEIESYHDAITAIRRVTHCAYKRYEKILITSDKLKDCREICKQWCHPADYLNLNKDLVLDGISNLAKFLHVHYQKMVVLLVDEFDAICRAAMYEVDEKVLNKIIRAYFSLFNDIIKTDVTSGQPFIYKAVFTGITTVTCTGESGLNNVPFAKFLEKPIFSDFYGILQDEFEGLLEKAKYKCLKNQQAEALSFYNGYTSGEKKILCTYSVVNYLADNCQNANQPLTSYWCNSGDITRFNNAWRKKELRLVLRNMISGKVFRVPIVEKIPAAVLAVIHTKFTSNAECTLTDSDINVFLTYLQQLGYLGVVKKEDKNLVLSIPNEEIRMEFASILVQSYLTEYGIKNTILEKCAMNLNRLIDIERTDEENIREAFTNFKKELEAACQKYLVPKFLNEATLEHLVSAILLKTKFIPVSQVKITDSWEDDRYAPRVDLCLYKKNTGVIIELKFGDRETAGKTIAQIKTKKYSDIFTNNGRIEGITNPVYVGIHLNETGRKLSLAYTKDLAKKPVTV